VNTLKIIFTPLLVLSCLLLFQLQLFAADYSAKGRNSIGQTIMLQERANGLEINVYKNKYLKFNKKLIYSDHYYGSADEMPLESYLFETECPDGVQYWPGGKTLSCSKAGKSPLAKTQYIQWIPKGRTDSCGGQARFLRCIKGCESKRVPKIIEELPYECE
jgi:hypothetical protein